MMYHSRDKAAIKPSYMYVVVLVHAQERRSKVMIK